MPSAITFNKQTTLSLFWLHLQVAPMAESYVIPTACLWVSVALWACGVGYACRRSKQELHSEREQLRANNGSAEKRGAVKSFFEARMRGDGTQRYANLMRMPTEAHHSLAAAQLLSTVSHQHCYCHACRGNGRSQIGMQASGLTRCSQSSTRSRLRGF